MFLEHPDRANLPTLRRAEKEFAAADRLFYGKEPVEERIRWFTLTEDTELSRKAGEYIGKLDTYHVARFAIDKFITLRSRGCVVFDIDKPIPIVGRRASFTWLDGGEGTGSEELIESIRDYNPSKFASVLLYAVNPEKTILHACSMQVPFFEMRIPEQILEKAKTVKNDIDWTHGESDEDTDEDLVYLRF